MSGESGVKTKVGLGGPLTSRPQLGESDSTRWRVGGRRGRRLGKAGIHDTGLGRLAERFGGEPGGFQELKSQGGEALRRMGFEEPARRGAGEEIKLEKIERWRVAKEAEGWRTATPLIFALLRSYSPTLLCL